LGSRTVVLMLLLGLGLLLPAQTELLKLELLQRPTVRFTLKLDIFHGNDTGNSSVQAAPTPATAAQAENLQKSIAEEIAQSITYEGFIMKNSKRSALLNVSGEFFSVGEGESVLDKIKILKISKDAVSIEYDGQPYEIRIKGDQDG
jgi:hypothetical protein